MIIATAGHVDHGKTSLVRALTGIDTDRLPEEKSRGLTIDLGFAYSAIGGGGTIGFVDVPGHERFVHNMLCGVAGIDCALFVIAADDGPKPQTREHLAILDLLQVRHGVIALTKIDRVSAERLAAVRAEIAALFARTTLAGVPIFPVSAVTGEGVKALAAQLQQMAQAFPQRAQDGNFRLAVDRTFTLPGAGLIATGTVVSGRLSTGEQVKALLAGETARVRSIHAQNAPASAGHAGQRCALNLASTALTTEQLHRGDWIVSGATAPAVRKLDARVRVLVSEAKPLQHWTPVHVHLGASDVTARIALLDAASLAPGASGLAQLVLDKPIGAVYADRFILRDQSAQRTIGGGRVIDVFPPTRGRAKTQRLDYVRAMAIEDPSKALAALLALATQGLDLQRFAANRNLTAEETTKLFETAALRRVETNKGVLGFARMRWGELKESVLVEVAAWHRRTPEQAGPSEQQLLGGAGMPRDVASAIAADLVAERALARSGLALHLPTHRPTANAADAALWERTRGTLEASGTRPPTAREIAEQLRADPKKVQTLLERAVRQGEAHRVADGRFFLAPTLVELAQLAAALAQQDAQRKLTVAAFRDRSGLGRNVSIEVLEYFDRLRFTRRVGDAREVLRAPEQVFAAVAKRA
jgi:selenocysteine-specific elongation factor